MSFGIDIFDSKNIGSSSAMITTEPLMGSSNYLAWAFSIELWCKGQCVQDHLTNNACVVEEKAKASEADDKAKTQWEKVDAQLCSLLWRSIDSKLMPLFLPSQTCYSVWENARALFTNDISRFYDVISRMTNLKKQESNMSTYLGHVQAVMEEFETLMSVTTNVNKQQEHKQTLFLVLTLVGLPPDRDSVRDQILASPAVPTIDE
uniref:Integrase core domain containing protein n=1 Tax=Solanum tuberosum TaxID=4113 RepID=M1B6A7_SOLTU